MLAGCSTASSDLSKPAESALTAESTGLVHSGQNDNQTGAVYVVPEMKISEYNEQAASVNGTAGIDVSDVSDGVVFARAESDKSLKFQVVHDDIKYNYDLPSDGTPQCFVLQSGNGNYNFRIMENVTEDKFAELYSVAADVQLKDEFEPFLRPNQMVNYTEDSECVKMARQLVQNVADDTEATSAIYDYISKNIAYDTQKAQTVKSGYLPNPDATLAEGKGICYDYASLAAAMLRSVGIPTKVITGYVTPNDIYHAWNMVYLKNQGWITVAIKTDGDTWDRIDLTMAAGTNGEYTGDGVGYTDRFTY